jgi:prepilin-type N-terminal cleavage/methylation domain-containing protein
MTARKSTHQRGFTLLEVMIVMTIMGVLIAIPTPIFLRAVEQSKLDVATANLRSIWSAQRMYRMENGRYGSLSDLAPGGDRALLDPSILSPSTFYGYAIVVSADGQTFVATAQHPATSQCNGTITIDESGTLTCNITYSGAPMSPSLEPGS